MQYEFDSTCVMITCTISRPFLKLYLGYSRLVYVRYIFYIFIIYIYIYDIFIYSLYINIVYIYIYIYIYVVYIYILYPRGSAGSHTEGLGSCSNRLDPLSDLPVTSSAKACTLGESMPQRDSEAGFSAGAMSSTIMSSAST